jgi:single-stranded DNA-binding protein
MPTLIKLKIDVTKLDKNLFFKAKSGAVYADLDFWMTDEDDQYGQCGMIRQDVGAERRKAGEKGNILGNGKPLQPRQPAAQAQNSFKPTAQASTAIEDEDDDIPF